MLRWMDERPTLHDHIFQRGVQEWKVVGIISTNRTHNHHNHQHIPSGIQTKLCRRRLLTWSTLSDSLKVPKLTLFRSPTFSSESFFRWSSPLSLSLTWCLWQSPKMIESKDAKKRDDCLVPTQSQSDPQIHLTLVTSPHRRVWSFGVCLCNKITAQFFLWS